MNRETHLNEQTDVVADESPQYLYSSDDFVHSNGYLLPAVLKELNLRNPSRILDLDCGTGQITSELDKYFQVIGVDNSKSGIAQAMSKYPNLEFHLDSVYSDLAKKLGTFDCVVSLEVIEHLVNPRLYALRMFDLLNPGGMAIVSTPYHGYLKNLALAVTGKFDDHFTALWDGGHIKFWSIKTLSALFLESGFQVHAVHRVGRVPIMAKSMILIASKSTT